MTNDYTILPSIPGEPLSVIATRFYCSPEIAHLPPTAQIGAPAVAVKRAHAIVHHIVDQLSSCSDSSLTSCLDVGCNEGLLTSFLARHFTHTVGVDCSPHLIESAARRYPGVSFRIGDARSLDIPSASYDVVVCAGLIHYLPDWQAILAECARVLKPNGFLILQFARSFHPAHRLIRAFGATLIGKRSWKTTCAQVKRHIEWRNWHLRFRSKGDPFTLDQVTDFLRSIQVSPTQLHLPRRFPGVPEDQVAIIAQHSHPEVHSRTRVCADCLRDAES